MKKYKYLFIFFPLIVSCSPTNDLETSSSLSSFNSSSLSENESSSSSSSISPILDFEGSINFNCIYEEKNENTSTFTGLQITYYYDDTVKGYEQKDLIFDENNNYSVSDSATTYLADLTGNDSDILYQEALSCKNTIEKSYVLDSSNNTYKFSEVFSNPFYDLSIKSLKILDDKCYFTNSLTKEVFLNTLPYQTDTSNDNYFILDSNYKIIGFKSINEKYTLTIDILKTGNNIEISHISPLVEDTTDKTDLQKAIENLGSNYTVTHLRPITNQKFQVYYDGSSILLDNSNNGISSQDSYYSKSNDSTYLSRLVYGKKGGIGPNCWDKDNYQEMVYDDDKTYEDLLIRLNQINLGLFHNDGNGKYTTINGAEQAVFNYCMPTMNNRALYKDNATKVIITIENQEITKIQLKYSIAGGTTETIKFSNVGTTSIPEEYLKTLYPSNYQISESILGTWKYEAEKDTDDISLTINSDYTGSYTFKGAIYSLDKILIEEKYDSSSNTYSYTVGFNYNNNTRFVNLGLSNNALSGMDCSYSDYINDYQNIELTKI